MSAHTPGPWSVNGNAIEADAAEALIAHVYDPEDNGADEWRANTRLISAAPDLFAALRVLVAGLRHGTAGMSGDDALRLAEAAIAKACGGSNA